MPEEGYSDNESFQDSFDKFKGMLDPKEIIRGQVKICSLNYPSDNVIKFVLSVDILEAMLPDMDQEKDYKKKIEDMTKTLGSSMNNDIKNMMVHYGGNSVEDNEIQEKYEIQLALMKFKEIIKFMQKHNLWLDKELTRVER